MNLSLLDPLYLALDCPETFIGGFHSGHSTSIRFNKKGDLLGSGRFDGTIVIFDVETNGVARKLRGHTRHVQSLSWSSCGRYLLSASQDWKCVLWDLKDGSRVRTVRFTAPVFYAELHPTNHLCFAAAIFDDQPVIVDVSQESTIKRSFTSAPKRSQLDREKTSEKQLAKDARQTTTIIAWSRSGNHVIAGTNGGWINIIDANTCETVWSSHVSPKLLTLLRLTPTGREMVINSSDKIIRLVRFQDLDDPAIDFNNFRFESEQKYQDIVNENYWNHVAFSSTGEYIVASISMNHTLYVWETTHSSLEKILEGPREELAAVEWHPHKPFLAAVGAESGRIYLWAVIAPQKWSALAPDFLEVEENVEYVEREDEFDIHDTEEMHKRIMRQEDEDIDVLTIDQIKKPGDVDDTGFQIPVLLDVEDSDSEEEVIAVGAGQFRRKSPGQGKEWAIEQDEAYTSDAQSTPRRSPRPITNKRRRQD